MVKRSKKILSAIVATTLALSLVGCGSAKATEGGKKGTTEIVMWTPFTGPDSENMNALVAEYNSTNPQYKIKHVPMSDIYTKVQTTVQSGKDVPGLSIIHADRVKTLADSKIIVGMQEELDKNGNIKADEYVDSAWNLGEYNGERYSVPLDVHSFVTYYNEDLLAKYGPNVLEDGVITMDEVISVNELASKDGIKTYGITWMWQQLISQLYQVGGSFTKDGQVDLVTPELQRVLSEYEELVKTGVATQDGDDPGQLFRSGQLVFLPEGIWMLNSLTTIPNLNFGMTHMVSMDASKQPVNATGSHQFALLKDDKRSEEEVQGALAFVDWVADNSLEWAKAGQNPAAVAIKSNEEYQKLPQSFLMDAMDSMVVMDYKHIGYIQEAVEKVVFEVAFGRMSAEDAVKQAQKEVDDRLKMIQ